MGAGHVTQNPKCSSCRRTMRRRKRGGWNCCGTTVLDIQPIPKGQEVCCCPGFGNRIYRYVRECPLHRELVA